MQFRKKNKQRNYKYISFIDVLQILHNGYKRGHKLHLKILMPLNKIQNVIYCINKTAQADKKKSHKKKAVR